MNSTLTIPRLSLLYPTARIRGRLITRLEEQTLRWVVLDAVTADEMGREHVGWFVGNHSDSVTLAVEKFGRLDANPEGGVWVVVPHSRELACELFVRWPHLEHVAGRPSEDNSAWRSRKVWFAIPEDLKYLLPLIQSSSPGLAGVILLDPHCVLHRSRGGTDATGKFHRNDRPQHVVNFLAAFHSDEWQPPLLLITTKPAKAIDTEVVARAYCLNGFRFVDGSSFACWEEPIDND